MTVQEEFLEVRDLAMHIRGNMVLDGADLTIGPGQMVGLVGESGSGKSMLCRTLTGTQGRYDAQIVRGSIRWRERELVGITEDEWRTIRGSQIGFVPQASMAGLNPTMTIGRQLFSLLRTAKVARSRSDLGAAAERMLEEVKIVNPRRVLGLYPNELSGGMRQRVMIAGALLRQPLLLVADEPTTALDVTVQAKILDLLREIGNQRGMAILLVTHDLAVVSELCSTVTVMASAATVEAGPIAEVLGRPIHPYTETLVRSSLSMLRQTEGDHGEAGNDVRSPVDGGCRYLDRCGLAADHVSLDGSQLRCETRPELRVVGEDHLAACHFAGEPLHQLVVKR